MNVEEALKRLAEGNVFEKSRKTVVHKAVLNIIQREGGWQRTFDIATKLDEFFKTTELLKETKTDEVIVALDFLVAQYCTEAVKVAEGISEVKAQLSAVDQLIELLKTLAGKDDERTDNVEPPLAASA